jgi:hypothetical protein
MYVRCSVGSNALLCWAGVLKSLAHLHKRSESDASVLALLKRSVCMCALLC